MPLLNGLREAMDMLFEAHLGDLNELMLLGALAGAEMAVVDEGIAIEPGSAGCLAQGASKPATCACCRRKGCLMGR